MSIGFNVTVLVAASLFSLFPALPIQDKSGSTTADSLAPGALIPATATMVSAWDIPRNPFTDSLPNNPYLAAQVRYGYKLFTNTPEEAPFLGGNKLSCSHCHLNAGQREKGLPLVGVSAALPEYNKRAGRLFTMEDRIVECFKRSMDADVRRRDSADIQSGAEVASPNGQSMEVLAISAYISWLSAGVRVGEKISWRGENVIPPPSLIPVEKLDPMRGEELFKEKCVSCHGDDGQGVEIGDKKAGPLWGPDSWNDGAGAARVYTLAGMIRYFMPYLDPGNLTDEEAQQIAAYIDALPRPVYPHKDQDYQKEPLPPDAVYYTRRIK